MIFRTAPEKTLLHMLLIQIKQKLKTSLLAAVCVYLPTDRRVGEESLEQPWLRGMRLRLRPSPLAPASTLCAPELMVLRAVLVSTRPGEPLRLPASEMQRDETK